jgi:hypothetical protein
MFPELLTGFKCMFSMHLQLFNGKRLSLQQKTRSYNNSFPLGALIAATQLKETLTPAEFDGAVFKHLTIANDTHTAPVIGKACHQNTNNFHLFFVISVKLSMKHQMELFPRFLCTGAGRCILYALHWQRFQSYYLEAMNHHDCRRVSEKEKHSFLGTNISFPKNKSNICTY